MKPIKTVECNVVYRGDGADVVDVHAEQVKDHSVRASFNGALEVRIYWSPTDEERARIADGENIRIHMLHGVSPHWLEVVDSPEIEEDHAE